MAPRRRPLTPVLVDLRVVLLGLALGVAGWAISGLVVRFGPGGLVQTCSLGNCVAPPSGAFWVVQPGILVFLAGLILLIVEVYSGTRGRRAVASGAPA